MEFCHSFLFKSIEGREKEQRRQYSADRQTDRQTRFKTEKAGETLAMAMAKTSSSSSAPAARLFRQRRRCVSTSTATTSSSFPASEMLRINRDDEEEDSEEEPARTPHSTTQGLALYLAESLSSEGFADLVRTFDDDKSLELLPTHAHGDFSAGRCTSFGDADDDDHFFSLPIGHPSIASALGPTQLVLSL